MSTSDREPPFEGGSQPVPQKKEEMPSGGRSVGQVIVLVIAVLAVLAAVVWFFV